MHFQGLQVFNLLYSVLMMWKSLWGFYLMTRHYPLLSRSALFTFGSSYCPISLYSLYYSPSYDNQTVSSQWTYIYASRSIPRAWPSPHSTPTSLPCIDLAAAWCYPSTSGTSTFHCLAAYLDCWSLNSCIYSLPSFSRIFRLPPSSWPLILPGEVRISSSKQTVSGVPVLNLAKINQDTNIPISSILTYRSSWATWYRSLSLSYSSLI